MRWAERALGRDAAAGFSNVTLAPAMRRTVSRPPSAPERERLHLALQGVAVDAEGAGRPAQVVVVHRERVEDGLALGSLRHPRERLDGARRATQGVPRRRAP